MDLRKIARNLEKERCSKHNEKPTATPKRDSIDITCCCDKFKAKLNEKIRLEFAKQAKDEILKSFKF